MERYFVEREDYYEPYVVSDDLCTEKGLICYIYRTDPKDTNLTPKFGLAIEGKGPLNEDDTSIGQLNVGQMFGGNNGQRDTVFNTGVPKFDENGKFDGYNTDLNSIAPNSTMNGVFYINYDVHPCIVVAPSDTSCVTLAGDEVTVTNFTYRFDQNYQRVQLSKTNEFLTTGAFMLPLLCTGTFLVVGAKYFFTKSWGWITGKLHKA